MKKKKLIQRTTLAENIAGDTVISHTTAFANLWESISSFETSEDIHYSRTLASEIERIAIHTGDLSAICTDIAYQLGSSVLGRLRTPVINFFQEWGGNRLAKGLLRVGKNQYPFTEKLAKRLLVILADFERDFDEINMEIFKLPSALSRLERTGELTFEQIKQIGTVGIAARMNSLERDIRKSHPYNLYKTLNHETIIKHHGDVYSRAQIRRQEVKQSITYIKKLFDNIPEPQISNKKIEHLKPNSFNLSLTEGWRGEICHTAITDEKGELIIYKIKDPSFHNWLALGLAVK